MNILSIGTTDNRGGAGRLSMSLASGLELQGHTVRHIVGYKYSQNKSVYELSHVLPAQTRLMMRHARSFITSNDIDFGQDDEIINHPWFKEAEIVILHNKHGNFVSLDGIIKIAQTKPTIWTLHDMWPITTHCAYTVNPNSKKHDPYDCNKMSYPPLLRDNGELYRKKMKKLSNAPITYITPSQWLKSKVLQTPLRNKEVHHIPNGIDNTIFSSTAKQSARSRCLLDQNKRYALFLAEGGEKNFRKGMDSVVKLSQSALIRKMAVQFLVVGGTKNKTSENITFAPRTDSQHLLANYYSSADVLMFPSQADNCPLTVLESLAVGTKVLAFDTCGVGELINHTKNGYLARLGSNEDFEKGFVYLMNQQVEKASSLLKSSNTIHGMVKAYEKLMKSLVVKR